MKIDEAMNKRKASHHTNYYDIRQLIMSHFAIKTRFHSLKAPLLSTFEYLTSEHLVM